VVEIDRLELAAVTDRRWRQRFDSVARSLGFTERYIDARGYGGDGPVRLEPLVE